MKHVLVVRCFDNYQLKSTKDRRTLDEVWRFQYPKDGRVISEEWIPDGECGGGLHGWLWGCGHRLYGPSRPCKWMVLRVPITYRGKCNIVGLRNKGEFGPKCKVKFRVGTVVLVGSYQDCRYYVCDNRPEHIRGFVSP